MHAQKGVPFDVAELKRIFDLFARWQTVRVILQLLNFGFLLWSLVQIAGA
jgi:hypothetical protein